VTKTRLIAIIGKRVYRSLTHSHSSSRVSGRIPTDLGQLTALTKLCLHCNELTGECDHKTRLIAIGKRVYHSITDCSVCLTDRIPTEIGQLTALTHFALRDNQLTGECD